MQINGLSIKTSSKVLASIFAAQNPILKNVQITDETTSKVKEQLEQAGFNIKLPVKIKIADDYAELFTHILGEVNDDDVTQYAGNKALHAANFGRSGGSADKRKFHDTELSSCEHKISMAKTVIESMEKAGLIEINHPLAPAII